jgi:hypothetical protein
LDHALTKWLHPPPSRKESPDDTPKKKGTPAKKLTFAEAAIAAMEAEEREGAKAGSESEEWSRPSWWIGQWYWCRMMLERFLIKMMITPIFIIIVLGIVGGELFALLAGCIHDSVKYVDRKWGCVKMMMGLTACNHHKNSPRSQKILL